MEEKEKKRGEDKYRFKGFSHEEQTAEVNEGKVRGTSDQIRRWE